MEGGKDGGKEREMYGKEGGKRKEGRSDPVSFLLKR